MSVSSTSERMPASLLAVWSLAVSSSFLVALRGSQSSSSRAALACVHVSKLCGLALVCCCLGWALETSLELQGLIAVLP